MEEQLEQTRSYYFFILKVEKDRTFLTHLCQFIGLYDSLILGRLSLSAFMILTIDSYICKINFFKSLGENTKNLMNSAIHHSLPLS